MSLHRWALDYAALRHLQAGNVRKYTGLPYIVHPAAVVRTLKSFGVVDEEVLAAAACHDLVEDADVSLGEITERFGLRVMSLVYQLTNVALPKHGNREARFLINLQHLQVASPEAQTIKYADIADNIASIAEHDWKFAKVYIVEKFRQMAQLRSGDPVLREHVMALLHRINRQLGEPTHA